MWSRLVAWLRPRTRSLGERGERAAARYLRQHGYRILGRRLRFADGEIDLLATDGTRVIFVEVKTRRSAVEMHPAEAVDLEKQRRLSRAARSCWRQHRLGNTPARFDVVAVYWPDGRRHPRIEHYPGAFEPLED